VKDHGQIRRRVGGEQNRGVLDDVQIHVAQKMDRAGQKFPGGHDHASAAGLIACGDGVGKRLRAVRRPIANRAIIGDDKIMALEISPHRPAPSRTQAAIGDNQFAAWEMSAAQCGTG
jgi:hypothetical protein